MWLMFSRSVRPITILSGIGLKYINIWHAIFWFLSRTYVLYRAQVSTTPVTVPVVVRRASIKRQLMSMNVHRCRREYDISPVECATFTLRLAAVTWFGCRRAVVPHSHWLSKPSLSLHCSPSDPNRIRRLPAPPIGSDGPRSREHRQQSNLPTAGYAAAAAAAVYDVSFDIIPHETRITCATDVTELSSIYSWNLHQSINYKCRTTGDTLLYTTEHSRGSYHLTTQFVIHILWVLAYLIY